MSGDLTKFKITFDKETKTFSLMDDKGHVVETGPSGKALGKQAWKSGADWVCYDYDLKMDEK